MLGLGSWAQELPFIDTFNITCAARSRVACTCRLRTDDAAPVSTPLERVAAVVSTPPKPTPHNHVCAQRWPGGAGADCRSSF